jgi:hypothetical protein
MDPLHSIILALTPTEKRYLKMYMKTLKIGSQVIRLFEELNRMGVYDEQVLSRKTGISDLIGTKFSLRKIVFKAMRNYHEGVDIKQELRDDISNIDFLVRKGLKEEATKEIKKAIKIAKREEAYAILSELLVYASVPEKPLKSEDIQGHFEEALSLHLETIRLQTEVQQAELNKTYMTYVMSHGNYESPHEFAKQVSDLGLQLEEKVANTKSDFAKICLLVGLAAGHSDKDKCLKVYEQIHQLYKQEPHNIQKHPNLYFTFLANYSALILARKEWAKTALRLFDEREKALITFDYYFKYYPDKLADIKNTMLCNKLTYCKLTKDWRKIDQYTIEVKESLLNRQYRKALLSSLAVAFLIPCLFEIEKYSETVDWVQTYYSLPSAKMLKPLMLCIRFYECVGFHMMGNYDLSEVKSKNLVKTISEQGLNDDYYKLLSALLRRLNHWVIGDKRHQSEISEFQMKFEKLANEKNGHYVLYTGLMEPDKILTQVFLH